MRRTATLYAGISLAMLLAIGGVGRGAEEEAGPIGQPLPGTDPVAFEEAAEAFRRPVSIEDGLGPTFNQIACANCHAIPTLGGSGAQLDRRFGRITNGRFFGFDADEENQGGTLRQLFSNGTYESGSLTCTIPLDTLPARANVRDVGRRPTPLFGLGLVDAMPDSWFDRLAAAQPTSIRGVVQRVPVVLPDPRDPVQSVGSSRVGRFGLKALVPSLLVFSGDAYDNEMGVTTQSCYKGTSILEFAVENHPNNVEPPPGCNGGDLAPAQPPGDPEVPEFTDRVVGACSSDRTEIQSDLVRLTAFVEALAPPPIDLSDPVSFAAGGSSFRKIGCAVCHVATPFVTPTQPFNGVPGSFAFFPFSDFLAHDMGTLGDGTAKSGEPVAKTRLIRTSPLWGTRYGTRFLHDGRAASIREAILAHDGQGAPARNAFNALGPSQQRALIKFVNSI